MIPGLPKQALTRTNQKWCEWLLTLDSWQLAYVMQRELVLYDAWATNEVTLAEILNECDRALAV